jgi:large subunit ribosomal protein L32e
MNNRTYAGELSHNLSARVKTQIVKRAAELDVKLLNQKSKLKTEEKKE